MRNFLQLATNVNVLPALLAIQRRPDLWTADTYLRHYPQGPFEDIDSIMLRFPEKVTVDTEEKAELYRTNMLPGFDQHESIDYPAYAALPEFRPLVQHFFGLVGGTRLGRVMVNRIRPGGRIFPHADTKAHTDYYTRFHLVLQSKPGVRFLAGDEEVYMGTGEFWWFDNKQVHEVINNSDTDRIHMVMDARCSA